MEGEPRWEYKFIRRAEDDDTAVQLVSMLRTSENKIYRQGVKDALELAQGFPTKPEDLFGFDGTDRRLGGCRVFHLPRSRR